jgi:hypothetical protein
MFEFKITPHYHMLHVYFFHFAFDENVYSVTRRIKLCFISFWLEVSSMKKSLRVEN